MRWANEWFYYLQQARNMIKSFLHPIFNLSRDLVNSIELSPSTSYRCFTHPTVTSSFDNAPELIEIDLKKDNQLHADGIVSLDLDFKVQFGNRLLIIEFE